MPRTTKEAVRAIAPALESMPDETLDAMIAAAHTSVNKLAGSSCGSEMTEDDLTQIETWLSAHYATIADPKSSGTTQEKFEGSSKTFAVSSLDGQGVLSTRYGQTANMLSCGCLAEQQLRNTFLDVF